MLLKTKNARILDEKTKVGGKPLLTFQINLEQLKLSEGKSLGEKAMSFALETESSVKFSMFSALAKFITEIEKSEQDNDRKFLECLNSANDCTYVYWGCGSCGDNYCRVDVYCDSSGSGTPDYSYCELCC